MTAISYLNPYAPQPASTMPEASITSGRATLPPVGAGAPGGNPGHATDHSGYGAGNGTGTGGAHLDALLKRTRSHDGSQKPTPKSVIEAQLERDPATEFLARQARLKAEGDAAEKTRIDERAAARAAQAEAAAEKAAEPEYQMPNPLPTAPILKRETDAENSAV